MIGKPKWFTRRKYVGWGLCPRCWQGWVYLVAVLAPFLILSSLPFGSEDLRWLASSIWGGLVIIDVVHVMAHMEKDERERLHEAIAERNALWVIIIMLCLGAAYQAAAGGVDGVSGIDPVILAALLAGVATKAATNIYLDRNN